MSRTRPVGSAAVPATQASAILIRWRPSKTGWIMSGGRGSGKTAMQQEWFLLPKLQCRNLLLWAIYPFNLYNLLIVDICAGMPLTEGTRPFVDAMKKAYEYLLIKQGPQMSQPQTQSDHQIQTQTHPDQQIETQPDQQVQTQPDQQIETQPDQQIQTQPDQQIQTQPDQQIQTQPDQQVQTQPDQQIQTQPDQQIETQPDQQIQTQPDQQVQTQPDQQIQTQPDQQIETQPDQQIQTQPDQQVQTQPDQQIETQPDQQIHTKAQQIDDGVILNLYFLPSPPHPQTHPEAQQLQIKAEVHTQPQPHPQHKPILPKPRKRKQGCRKCSRQKVWQYDMIVDKRMTEDKAEVKVRWLPCSQCGKTWEDTWEPASQVPS
ncbi:mediator of RNA polymerase II transcription subunit 15 isoform X2 [Carassius auratus]|uniref:Mediator of RNA polymerase II transcription subunit 15 isoform X2 n=1 Tax=Carassius auratus TaxID=7957 RepID=A0A6P6LVK7_CARAU|nr:mediator of RNA polymerase II transcription subunit 15-like isoform X2 [Carassius auratus]